MPAHRALVPPTAAVPTTPASSFRARASSPPPQNKPPSECQELLGPVLRSLTTQLSNPAPWLSRELRNPLAAFEAPPTVRVPSATALCASRICSTAAYVARCAPPLGPMLLLDHRVLWSGLQAEETADVHALLQLGAVAAPPTTAPILAPAGAPRRPAAEAGAAADPPADGGAAASSAREALGPGLCWQQVALSTGAGLDCEPRLWVWREPAPAHGGPPTSHPAGSSVRGVPRGWLREASGERRCFTLAMLVFGRLLLVVPMDLAASAMDIATLHACVLPEIEILQKMVRSHAARGDRGAARECVLEASVARLWLADAPRVCDASARGAGPVCRGRRDAFLSFFLSSTPPRTPLPLRTSAPSPPPLSFPPPPPSFRPRHRGPLSASPSSSLHPSLLPSVPPLIRFSETRGSTRASRDTSPGTATCCVSAAGH